MPKTDSGSGPTPDELALIKAAYAGDRRSVESLVAGGANINVQSNEFYDMGKHRKVTPLMCAADKGHLEVVRWLLEHQADHAAQTTLTKSDGGPGTQALHFAAAGGHDAVVAALLDAGADPNAQGRFGRTPITFALLEGHLGCARLLLARGASASAKSRHKGFEAPLAVLASGVSNTTSMVARNGKLVPAAKDLWDQKETLFEVFRDLLTAGADPSSTDSSGLSALHALARRIPDEIRLPIAQMLLDKGAAPDPTDKNGDSPLLVAALYRSIRFARLLLDYPVDVNRLCPRGSIVDVIESNIATANRDMATARAVDARAALEAEVGDMEALVELLKSRGGKRKSELAIPVEIPKPEARHIASDFLELVNSGEPEWALLVVRAPFDAVSDAYLNFAKSKDRQQNVPVRPAADGEAIPPVAAVVQVKDGKWILILRSILYVRAPDIKHVSGAAKELSKTLSTRALTFVGTDETENGLCELFENGKSIGKAGDSRSIAMLTRENIILPACYPIRDGDNYCLAVEQASLPLVARADLIAR